MIVASYLAYRLAYVFFYPLFPLLGSLCRNFRRSLQLNLAICNSVGLILIWTAQRCLWLDSLYILELPCMPLPSVPKKAGDLPGRPTIKPTGSFSSLDRVAFATHPLCSHTHFHEKLITCCCFLHTKESDEEESTKVFAVDPSEVPSTSTAAQAPSGSYASPEYASIDRVKKAMSIKKKSEKRSSNLLACCWFNWILDVDSGSYSDAL